MKHFIQLGKAGTRKRFMNNPLMSISKSFGSVLLIFPFTVFGASSATLNTSCIDNSGNLPDFITMDATNISQTTARLNGYLYKGNNVRTWFLIGLNANLPSCIDSTPSQTYSSFPGRPFAFNLSGLIGGAKYFYKACARNDFGFGADGKTNTFLTKGDETISSIECGEAFSGGIEGLNVAVNIIPNKPNVSFTFDAFRIPDSLVVKDGIVNSRQVYTTDGFVSGVHEYSFPASSNVVTFNVVGSESGTAWNLITSCSG